MVSLNCVAFPPNHQITRMEKVRVYSNINFYFVQKEQPFIKVIIIEIAHSVKKFQAQPILQYHHLPLLSCRALKQIILLCWVREIERQRSFFRSCHSFIHRLQLCSALFYFVLLLVLHCRWTEKEVIQHSLGQFRCPVSGQQYLHNAILITLEMDV